MQGSALYGNTETKPLWHLLRNETLQSAEVVLEELLEGFHSCKGGKLQNTLPKMIAATMSYF